VYSISLPIWQTYYLTGQIHVLCDPLINSCYSSTLLSYCLRRTCFRNCGTANRECQGLLQSLVATAVAAESYFRASIVKRNRMHTVTHCNYISIIWVFATMLCSAQFTECTATVINVLLSHSMCEELQHQLHSVQFLYWELLFLR